MGAPDYFNYLKYLNLSLLITLKIALLLYIFKIDFWTCPIYFTDLISSCINILALAKAKPEPIERSLRTDSIPLLHNSATLRPLQENGKSTEKLIFNNNCIKSSTSESLGPYLAGLVEGDGHISLSKASITEDSKVRNTSPYIAITFVNKDLPLINKLVEKFGGRLRLKTKENAIVWTIGKHKELVNMINLLNGNFRTPKILKFNRLIVWLNEKFNYHIPIHSPDTSDLNKNGWLAGFIDADGGFKIRYTEKQLSPIKRASEKTSKILKKGRIEVRFVLEQRKNINGDFIVADAADNNIYSYETIMLKIYSFFGISTNLRLSKHIVDKTYFIVEITSLTKANILIQYLNTYPLLTAKRNDFDDWVKAYNLIFENKHLTDSGKLLIKQIKSNMNSKRVVFNWDHLNYLNKVQ